MLRFKKHLLRWNAPMQASPLASCLALIIFCLAPKPPLKGQSPLETPSPAIFPSTASLEQQFQQAKALWASQGDRDAASTQFEQIIKSLEDQQLTPQNLHMLCQSYNWLTVLYDRTPSKRGQVTKNLETILKYMPDFEIDKAITNTRLQKQFEALRASRLVKVTFELDPQGGTLTVDENPLEARNLRHIPPGQHKIRYEKPGYQSQEQTIELVLKEGKQLDFQLQRISSTVTFQIKPPQGEIWLDGIKMGQTQRDLQNPDLSAPFTLKALAKGKHLLEIKAPCYQSRLLALDPTFSEPFADHLLDPIHLDPSRARLSIDSKIKEGNLFLDGEPKGSLPIKDLQICAGSHRVEIRYPMGAYHAQIQVPEGGHFRVQAHPKLRLACLGIEGEGEFASKAAFQKALLELQTRLPHLIYIPPTEQNPREQLKVLQEKNSADLTLVFKLKSPHELQAIISTLQEESSQWTLRCLDPDPLKAIVERINTLPALWVNTLGVDVADAPGLVGAWVYHANPEAIQAGLVIHQAITRMEGRVIENTEDFYKVLKSHSKDTLSLQQGNTTIILDMRKKPLMIPQQAPWLCYPALLSWLRIEAQGAEGEEKATLLLNQAITLMHLQRFDRALECLRQSAFEDQPGVSQGTVEYLKGLCLMRLGASYRPRALQAFEKAMTLKKATLMGPCGPSIHLLAQEALKEIKP